MPTLAFRPRARAQAWTDLRADCDTLGIRRRRLHATRHTLILLALDDGARGDVMEWITHDASKRTIRNAYTHLSWATRCAEMAKIRIDLATDHATRIVAHAGSPANDAVDRAYPITSRA